MGAVFKWVTSSATDADQLMREAHQHSLSDGALAHLGLVAEKQIKEEQEALGLKRMDLKMMAKSNFSLAEVEQLRAAYEQQLLSAEESVSVPGLDIMSLQEILEESAPRHKEMASLIHHGFDANHDGFVDMQELIVGLSSLCKGSVLQRLELGFRCYDIDSDGSLDWDEIKNMVWVLLRLHYECPPPQEAVNEMAHNVFRQLDTDRSGKVDLEEFVAGVVTMPVVMECFCREPPNTL